MRVWSEKTDIPKTRLVGWLGIGRSRYYDWCRRYGKVNEHNAWIPRDHWLLPWEKDAIVHFYFDHPDDGYRRLAYMLIDANVVAVSPSSVYRVLRETGLLRRWPRGQSKKGTGFQQPLKPHEHWHTDISYLNIGGTFFYLVSVLDGFSRYVVHWEIRESMTEADVEIVIQRARERFPDTTARIISDNGSQFIAKDFKEFIRVRDDPCADLAVLPAVERETGALAQDAQKRVSSAGHPALGRGRAAAGGGLRGVLQRRAAPQRHRVHCPEG